MEQQLKDRAIPYVEQYPRASDNSEARAGSALACLIPNIVVNAKDLLNDGRAADVAMPKVFLQIKDWWKGDRCQVHLHVRRSAPALLKLTKIGRHGCTAPAPRVVPDKRSFSWAQQRVH